MDSKIVIPLDGMTRDEALRLARALSDGVWGFKVNDLLLECGVSIVSELKEYGNVFADPKIHDIPNTAGNSMVKLVAAGANLVTVHASGGVEMMRAAKEAAADTKVLAVTVLTSLSEDDAHLIFGNPVKATVLQFARNAVLAGVDGIVCSPQELPILSGHEELKELLKVTPGIRPDWYQKDDDQRRVMTPGEAVKLGASHLVIGRPISEADSPWDAVALTNSEVQEALAAV